MTNSCTSVDETVENFVAHLFTQYCGGLSTPHSIPDASIKGINNWGKIKTLVFLCCNNIML